MPHLKLDLLDVFDIRLAILDFVASSGQLSDAIETAVVSSSTSHVTMIEHPGGTRVYLIAYYDSTSNYDLVLETYTVGADGTSITAVDSDTIISGNNDVDNVSYLNIAHVSGNVFAMMYRNNTTGKIAVSTFEVATDGTISGYIDSQDTSFGSPAANWSILSGIGQIIGDYFIGFASDSSVHETHYFSCPIDSSGNIGVFTADGLFASGVYVIGSTKLAEGKLIAELVLVSTDTNMIYTLEFNVTGVWTGSGWDYEANNPTDPVGIGFSGCQFFDLSSDNWLIIMDNFNLTGPYVYAVTYNIPASTALITKISDYNLPLAHGSGASAAIPWAIQAVNDNVVVFTVYYTYAGDGGGTYSEVVTLEMDSSENILYKLDYADEASSIYTYVEEIATDVFVVVVQDGSSVDLFTISTTGGERHSPLALLDTNSLVLSLLNDA